MSWHQIFAVSRACGIAIPLRRADILWKNARLLLFAACHAVQDEPGRQHRAVYSYGWDSIQPETGNASGCPLRGVLAQVLGTCVLRAVATTIGDRY